VQEEQITLFWIETLYLWLLPRNKRCGFKAFLIPEGVQSPWKHTPVVVPIEKLRRDFSPSTNAIKTPTFFPSLSLHQ